MANFIYSKALDIILQDGGFKWTTAAPTAMKAMLVTAAYVPDKDADDFLDVVETGWRAGASSATAYTDGITVTPTDTVLGAGDCANIVFTSISATPDPIVYTGVIIYKVGTGDADSPLLFYIGSATNLPVTSNGENITLVIPTAGLFEIVN